MPSSQLKQKSILHVQVGQTKKTTKNNNKIDTDVKIGIKIIQPNKSQ